MKHEKVWYAWSIKFGYWLADLIVWKLKNTSVEMMAEAPSGDPPPPPPPPPPPDED